VTADYVARYLLDGTVAAAMRPFMLDRFRRPVEATA
jgi:hypothetical protein